MFKKLVLFGNGRHIQCVYKVLQLEGVVVHGFCVDDKFFKEDTLLGKPVYKFSEFVQNCPPKYYQLFSPMSGKDRCKSRKEVFERFKNLNYEFYTFISQYAQLYTDRANIGENVFIGTGARTHPDVIIKDNCYIGEGTLIAHDCVINKHSYIGAGSILAGGCNIGECVFVGMGVMMKTDITIPDNTSLGIGISIHRDIPKAGVYLFSPMEEKWFKRHST